MEYPESRETALYGPNTAVHWREGTKEHPVKYQPTGTTLKSSKLFFLILSLWIALKKEMQIEGNKQTKLNWKSDLDASGPFLTGWLTFIGNCHEGFG